MNPTTIKFLYSNSFKQLEENIDKNIPATLLLSEKFVYANNYELINFLKNNLIKWIIIIGNNSSLAEEDLDFILESSLDENFIDIVTTNFSFSSIDKQDIVFEFLITSRLDYEDYQFLSVIDTQQQEELEIINLVNDSLNV